MSATYGSPILSPSNSQTFDLLTGKHGDLQVRALPDADTHALFYKSDRGWTMLATHPNGHSCKELANRILDAWNGKDDGARAVDQFDFIMRCGGTGRSLETILHVVRGQY